MFAWVGDDERVLNPVCALMAPGTRAKFLVEGEGSFLRFSVPDLGRDMVHPLLGAGHSREAIAALGGDDPSTSDHAL